MQKYHDEPKQYKGYLKSALVALATENIKRLARWTPARVPRVSWPAWRGLHCQTWPRSSDTHGCLATVELFDPQPGVVLRHCDTIPDDGKQRVRKPVQPPDVSRPTAVREAKAKPDARKLVGVESRDEVGAEAIGEQVSLSYVEVPLKRCDFPADKTFGDGESWVVS